MNFKSVVIVNLLLLGGMCGAGTVVPKTAVNRISAVKLYRNQAMVVRDVEVPPGTGEMALIVENLPESTVPGSLFASGNVNVRAVRYITELIKEKKDTDRIGQLEDQLKKLDFEKKDIATRRELLSQKQKYLETLQKQYLSRLGPVAATGKNGKTEVAGFDFATIEKMTTIIFKQRSEINAETLKYNAEDRRINAETADIQKELNTLRRIAPNAGQQMAQNKLVPSRQMRRRAVIYLAVNNDKPELTLSYLVNRAGWNPAYNMRTTTKGDNLDLEYLAGVNQSTGEDWNSVKLIISTATPNINAETPILVPMRVSLSKNQKYKASYDTKISLFSRRNLLAENVRRQASQVNKMQRSKSRAEQLDYNVVLNVGAWNRQNLEFNEKAEVISFWNRDLRNLRELIAVEYEIKEPVTLVSLRERQMVRILSNNLKCKLFYEAIPLFSGYVSRCLEVKNTIDQPLLAGSYSAFIDGKFVGRGNIPVTVTGQTITMGLGFDPQLKCSRELVDKSSTKSWGSRIEKYQYELVIDNYKTVPVHVRLLDRIPVTDNKELKISMTGGLKNLSTDPEYRDLEYPKGILRWDIKLPPSSSGSKATKIEYSFLMRFDSDMTLSGMDTTVEKQLRTDILDYKKRRERK